MILETETGSHEAQRCDSPMGNYFLFNFKTLNQFVVFWQNWPQWAPLWPWQAFQRDVTSGSVLLFILRINRHSFVCVYYACTRCESGKMKRKTTTLFIQRQRQQQRRSFVGNVVETWDSDAMLAQQCDQICRFLTTSGEFTNFWVIFLTVGRFVLDFGHFLEIVGTFFKMLGNLGFG